MQTADVVVTMGGGIGVHSSGKHYGNWELPGPAGPGIYAARPIRDQVEARVRQLLAELAITPLG